MGKLRPIGSEKLKGIDKINRIIEISRFRENIPTPINETSSSEFSKTLADGIEYRIDKEKNGYVIKKRIDESTFDYVEPMKNRKYYRSYSQAFKRLNLIVKEVNNLVGNDQEISLFNEQKYVLKTPKPEMPEPSPEPAPSPESEMTPPAPESETEEPSMDMPTDEPAMEPEGGEDTADVGEDSFKTVQKLTGKLAQKIRNVNDEDLTSDNIKYIVNSILSALDLSKLEDEDKEEIMGRLEPEEEMPSGEEEMPSDEMGMDQPEEPMKGEEMTEVSDSEMEGVIGRKIASTVGGMMVDKLVNDGELDEEKFVRNIFDGVFNESKVEKVLTKYFRISENEQKQIQKKRILEESKKIRLIKLQNAEIERLCESDRQINTAKEIIKKYPYAKVLGSTNLNNLVIEHKGNQIKITPKGNIL